MSIPKYDEMYRAFLNCLADGQAHKSKEVKDLVASVFSISEKEREKCCQAENNSFLITVLDGQEHISKKQD